MSAADSAIPGVEFYEGNGGWTDGRLGQANDLIGCSIQALDDEPDAGLLSRLQMAQKMLDEADVLLSQQVQS